MTTPTTPSTINTIADLRDVLFSTLRSLSDPTNPMDIERAKAINETAQVIINTAKVEVDHIKTVGKGDTGFMAVGAPALPATESNGMSASTTLVKEKPGVRVTQHRLPG